MSNRPNRRDAYLQVRVRDSAKDALAQRAEARGISVSELVRRELDQLINKPIEHRLTA